MKQKPGGTEGEFGYEWDRYREVIPLHRRQFEQWIQPIPLSFFKDKSFMDAGCGIGRNSIWPLEAGATSCYAFDYDKRTVQVARENLRHFPNCIVGFESIYDLTRENEFDIAFSIGVIHHLEHPRKAVKNIVRAIKPGGTFIMWVYGREGNERYLAWIDPLRRYVTSKIPLIFTRAMAIAMTAVLKGYIFLPHKNSYIHELRKRSFRHTEAMVFDQLLPHIANYWTRDEVMALVKDLPLEDIKLTHTHGISWTFVANKAKAN